MEEDSDNLFSFKLRNNESVYPRDLMNSEYGNLNIFITLHGLINFHNVIQLKKDGLLLAYIKNIIAQEFSILERESINDDYNPEEVVTNNQLDSSLILGKNLEQEKLYNQFLDNYQNKVITGSIWFNDDLNGVAYDYLGFSDESDYSGEYSSSIPFESVIFKYLITYLEGFEVERDIEDDLREKGYWKSKLEYKDEILGEYDDE